MRTVAAAQTRNRRSGVVRAVLACVAAYAALVLLGVYGARVLQMVRKAASPPPQADPSEDRYFRTCREAHLAGVYSIPRSSKAYRPALDADGDGLACEPYFGG
jgi:hypothetical protein